MRVRLWKVDITGFRKIYQGMDYARVKLFYLADNTFVDLILSQTSHLYFYARKIYHELCEEIETSFFSVTNIKLSDLATRGNE